MLNRRSAFDLGQPTSLPASWKEVGQMMEAAILVLMFIWLIARETSR
jgi:hypothetical protein